MLVCTKFQLNNSYYSTSGNLYQIINKITYQDNNILTIKRFFPNNVVSTMYRKVRLINGIEYVTIVNRPDPYGVLLMALNITSIAPIP